MRAAVLDMIASAKTEFSKQPTGEKARIKIGLSRFDHNTYEISPLSTDYDKLKGFTEQIKLQNYHAGTNGKKALEWLTPNVPASGSGHSEAAPKRFVFLVTDGLQDRHPNWYPINFSGPFGANDRTGALDATACAALKAKGVTVGVLYTTHVGIKGYEWYWQKPQPHVKPALQACASLSNEFKKMFKKAVLATSARLEK
jgi:hypothetical protein